MNTPTNKTDRNGSIIHENDIIQEGNILSIIVLKEDKFLVQPVNMDIKFSLDFLSTDCLIVGQITKTEQ
jgi:hypothetical protein